MKIKAAVLHEMGLDRPYADSEPVKIEELDLDPPEEGEVLVRVKAAGICHSDLSVLEGVRPRPLPMALGHEGAGVVEDVGAGVDDLARGDTGVEISARMREWCGQRGREEAIAILAEARIPSGHIYKPAETLTDPQVLGGGFLQDVEYPGTPSAAPVAKLDIRLSKTPAAIRHRAPGLGEHSRQILLEAGLSEEEVERLVADGVVGTSGTAG